MKLRSSVALVTGAASGIGRSTVLAFVKKGAARVYACDVNEDGLASLAKEGGSAVIAKPLDVASRETWKSLADEVHAAHGSLDVLVNNAGVGLSGGILDTPLEDWDWVIAINLWGVIHGSHYFAPKMVEAKKGQIVNVSSVFGFFGPPGVAGYVTTKFGVLGLSESMRSELAPFNVGVSTICPGLISTNIVKETRYHGEGADKTRTKVVSMYEKKNYSPDNVGSAIVRAVERNQAVVPVTPEAWALYYAKRAMPNLSGPLGRMVRKQSQ